MKTSRCRYRTSLAGFISALLLAVSADAATITVNSTADAFAFLSPCNVTVAPGATFTLDLMINGGTNTVGVQQSYLTFSNTLLKVIPQNGSCADSATAVQPDLSTFEVQLQNQVNNGTGEIAYASGTFGAGARTRGSLLTGRVVEEAGRR
jgi:hypothetical protein